MAKKRMKVVFLDRDGTVNKDEDYYLGSQEDWRTKVQILPGVIEGVRILNAERIPVFIVTNQAGVAVEQFPNLTENRMHEVNLRMLQHLEEQRAKIYGYAACPFVDSAYAEKVKSRRWTINPKYLSDGNPCIKPNIGMLEECMMKLGFPLSSVDSYVIGDRSSDVQLGLNARGTGIMIASWKTEKLKDADNVLRLEKENPGRVYVTPSFLDAVNYIKWRAA